MEEVCKGHSGLTQMIKDVKDDTDKQWNEINHIKNRPPVWCTVVMMVLSGLLGSIITYATLAVRIAQTARAAQ